MIRTIVIALMASTVATGSVAAKPSAEDGKLDVALVLAVDVSRSVNAARYDLQKEGIAAAFDSAEIANAIGQGSGNDVAVALLEFSDPDRDVAVIDWVRLASPADAHKLAARIRGLRRSSDGLTGVGSALLAAKRLLDQLPWPAKRRLVDVSGDGIANIGMPADEARDQLVAAGITINGLPILTEEPALESYYKYYLIGGPDAFELPAQNLAAFAEAIKRKLIRELLIS